MSIFIYIIIFEINIVNWNIVNFIEIMASDTELF